MLTLPSYNDLLHIITGYNISINYAFHDSLNWKEKRALFVRNRIRTNLSRDTAVRVKMLAYMVRKMIKCTALHTKGPNTHSSIV